MVDCGVHMIDLARYWLQSEPVRIHGEGAWVEDFEAPDHAFLHLDHACGAHTFVEMSFSFGHTARDPLSHFQYELIGDGGFIRYERSGYVLEARTGQRTEVGIGASEKNFAGMYEAFRQAIKTGDVSSLPSADDGIIASEIAWSATREAMANRVRPLT